MENKIREIIAAYAPDLSPEGKIRMKWGGWNHLSWIFDITLDGKSVLDILIDIMTSDDFNPEPYFPVNADYINRTRTIPSPYLRYFTDTETVYEEQSKKANRGNEVMEIESRLFDLYKEETKKIRDGGYSAQNPPTLPEELSKRGGADYSRLAVKLIRDIADLKQTGKKTLDEKNIHILNVPDTGRIFSEDPHKFCEIPVSVENADTSEGSFFNPLYPEVEFPDEIRDIIDRVGRYEKLTVEAAISQNPDKAKEALLANPLVKDLTKVESFLRYSLKPAEM
jgi:6-phospho-beta-glucosidase